MMKIKNLVIYGLMLLCLLGINKLEAQLVRDLDISAEKADIQFIAPNSYLLEIAGPDNYYFKQEVEYTQQMSISNINSEGEKFTDGIYTMQLTPIITLTEEEKVAISAIRAEMDFEKMAKFRKERNLPDEVLVHNINFSIRDGKFVSPEKEYKSLKTPDFTDGLQEDHPALYASINKVMTNYGQPMSIETLPSATDNTAMNEDDQVFFDDVIVIGSICVGQDCVNGENFGFDTGRYKENNLRVHFDDTSASASFPKNDWRITINDSSNGGASYFSIDDVTGSKVPFRIVAGAPTNSLYVDAQGDIGIGTASPVVEAHIADGDSPTLRLEQNGSQGFTAQTWDIAGNETNFFVRDVTNGSKLPFKIKPGADHNALFIDADNDIGLGTQSPSQRLHIESGNVYVKNGNVGIKKVPTVALDVQGNSKFTGTTLFTGDVSAFLSTGASFLSPTFVTVLRLDANNNRVGIGVASPGHLLELSADDAVKPNGGSWSAPSDKRLKTNIRDFADGLNKVLQIRPVRYNYNGKLGYPTDKEFIGVIAQEMLEIAPYTIKALNHDREGENYLAFDPSSLTYLLVNAVQEQQEMIDAQKAEINRLQSELSELQGLKAQVAALAEMVSGLNETASSEPVEMETTGDKE